MQMEKAIELKKSYNGGNCSHPDFDKEYCLSASTGDYICTVCGESFTKEEMDEIIINRTKNT